jgi:hypothetical protein
MAEPTVTPLRPTSPLATADAGHDFETDVGATYLVALLLGGLARGATAAATVRVSFQRAALDSPLDDLVIETESAVGRARLDLQVKRTFTFSAGDRNFSSVINACWDTFANPSFRSLPGNRLGVAIHNASRAAKERFDQVTAWALASSSSAEFFQRIETQGLSSGEMRKLVTQVTAQVRDHAGEAATDEALLGLFQRLVLLDFDIEREGSRDRTSAIEDLRALVPGHSLESAKALWGHLQDAVRSAGHASGDYTAQTLREHLLRKSIALLAPPSFINDLDRLQHHTKLVLDSIQNSIEGLVLDRQRLVDAVLERFDDGDTVFLTGRGGGGKSAILRAVGTAYEDKGPRLALAGERLDADLPGWDGFAGMLRLEHSLDELVLALSGADRPCLLIDGIERIERHGARLAINDLLAAIGRLEENAGVRWAIAITTRDETLPAVEDWLVLPGRRKGRLVRVPDLSAEEIASVARYLPHLSWVLAAEHVRPVIGNAYFLKVLAQSLAQAPSDQEIVTEAFIHRLWWERLVGRDRARQQAMLELGRRALDAWKPRLLPQGIDAAALQSLETDGILRRDPGTDTYWFGHDILHEWTVARLLGQHDDDIVPYLRSHHDPFWAFRALQLLACNRLETAAGGKSWRDLLRQVEADPSTDGRWAEAVVTAPLRSVWLSDLLPVVGETLLEGDSSRLAHFLRAVRTQEIEPRDLTQLAKPLRLSTEDLEVLALELAYPRVEVWGGVLRWLAPRLQQLPEGLREELTRIMVTWLRATPPGADFRREIAEAALTWHSVLRSPSSEWTSPTRDQEPYFDRLREIVFLAADAVPERIPGFLGEVRQAHHRSELGRWLARAQPALARYAPAHYADFCLDVVAPGWQSDRTDLPERYPVHGAPSFHSFQREDPEWSRLKHDHDFRPPSHLRGPFLLILEASESDGLRLINTFVNRATKIACRRSGDPGTSDSGYSLDFPWGRREFSGHREVYSWFRPNGHAPASVCSALMALEFWMERQVEAGREPEDLFRAVLSGSASIATVAVCAAISLLYPEDCLRAAVPLMTAPVVWEFEITRASMDRHATFLFKLPGQAPNLMEQETLDRDQRPQRQRQIRDLMCVYLIAPDSALRDQVFAAVRGFSDEMAAACGDPANYRQEVQGRGVQVWFELPPSFRERQAAAWSHLERMEPILQLSTWVRRSLDETVGAQGMTVADAVQRAQELERAGDFTQATGWDGDYDQERLQGIVGAAAAAVLLELDWTRSSGKLDWCTRVLVAAAEAPPSDDRFSGAALGSIKSFAAKGLMGLLRHRLANEPDRLAAFRLLQSTESRIVDILLEGGRELWDLDPVFCRNAVARELALVVRPIAERIGEFGVDESAVERWQHEVEERFLENVRTGRLADLTPLQPAPNCEFRTSHLRRALDAVPLARIADGTECGWVLEATDIGLAWTLAKYPDQHGGTRQFGHHWLEFLGDWMARLAATLAEHDVESHILAPLRASWPGSAPLTASLLDGYTVRRLAQEPLTEATKREWIAIADWVLPSDAAGLSPRSAQAALELLVHVRNARGFFTDKWQGAPAFIAVYDHWVELLAHLPWAFRALLAFGGAAGSTLGARRLLGWLTDAIERVEDLESLWREDGAGRSTAQALAALWKREEREIRRDPEALRKYVILLDKLKRAGEPLAARLLADLQL